MDIKRSMAMATELTRAGKLREATEMLQSLMKSPAASTAAASTARGDTDAIEGVFSRVGQEQPRPPAAAAERPVVTPRTKPRAGLAETLRKIAAGGMPAHGMKTTQDPDLPPGAQFLSARHGSPHGQRNYRLYIPAKTTELPMPLIVMLHGCTQTAEDFAIGTGMNAVAEDLGFMVVYPMQPSGANAQKCWNWFRPEDQVRGRGEPALIAGMVSDILRNHPVDPARVYIAGLSAGAAAAVIAASAYPEMFSAVGAHSGLAAGSARDVASAFATMRSGTAGKPHKTAVPTIVFQGLSDTTVHPQNGHAVIAQAVQSMAGLRKVGVAEASISGRKVHRTAHQDDSGRTMAELWEIEGVGHAWAGGNAQGSYTDPTGPDASRQMVRFFLQHVKATTAS